MLQVIDLSFWLLATHCWNSLASLLFPIHGSISPFPGTCLLLCLWAAGYSLKSMSYLTVPLLAHQISVLSMEHCSLDKQLRFALQSFFFKVSKFKFSK